MIRPRTLTTLTPEQEMIATTAKTALYDNALTDEQADAIIRASNRRLKDSGCQEGNFVAVRAIKKDAGMIGKVSLI